MTYTNKDIQWLFLKREETLKKRSNALEVTICDIVTDSRENVHIIAKRPTNPITSILGEYVVWSMYNNGIGDRTTYDGFYNGKYDMTEDEAFNEMMRRYREK